MTLVGLVAEVKPGERRSALTPAGAIVSAPVAQAFEMAVAA
jgi:hypothetical protein